MRIRALHYLGLKIPMVLVVNPIEVVREQQLSALKLWNARYRLTNTTVKKWRSAAGSARVE